MNIIVEGPDGSGKSTLADFLKQSFGYPLIHSGGPQKSPGEINDRIRKFLALSPPVIFDRFPAISEQIYAPIIRGENPVDLELVVQFYATRPFIIYCRDQRRVLRHVAKEHDTPEHLALVEKCHVAICKAYDDWAVSHATLYYGIGQDMQNIVKTIKEAR